MTRAQVASATVDPTGRLLVATSGRRVLRRAPGGPVQVVATLTRCAPSGLLQLGRSRAENGFGVVCGPYPSGPAGLRVERRAADGTLRWATTTPHPQLPLHNTSAALLDDLGRVWVGGTVDGPYVFNLGQLQAFSSAGPVLLSQRWSVDSVGAYGRQAFSELRPGPSHRVVVALDQPCCYTSSGQLPMSQAVGAVVPTPVDPSRAIHPFPTIESFVQRQEVDLIGRPVASRIAATSAALRENRTSPVELVTGLLATQRGAVTVEPIHRLYRSFFQRDPDIGGLRYYTAQSYAGRRLATIADGFAASPEFVHRYGALSPADFVRTLYRNVFGREGDAAGLDYWYRRLATGKITRGGMVVQFSESSEDVTRLHARTTAMAATFLLLDRRASEQEIQSWGSYREIRRNAVEAILGSEGYAQHVAATTHQR